MTPLKIVLATFNENKAREIAEILRIGSVVFVSLSAFKNAAPPLENRKTLKENAEKKAKYALSFTGLPAIADDTGLEVDFLNGAPGVFSARYAGKNASYADNNRKLLKELEGVPPEKRTASFKCVIALALPSGECEFAEGTADGAILPFPKGNSGFGYDPLFLPNGFSRTFAEMTADEKNSVSHRSLALKRMRKILKKIAGTG